MEVNLPEKFNSLFSDFRYCVYYGGRGSGKSQSVATALLLMAAEKPLRVLCTREIQRSIKESVKLLLSDQIKALGLEDFYDVLETEIRGKNGSLFVFSGLSTGTINSVKSTANLDLCWIEEAQSVSRKSWNILIPTIRNPNSRIFITMNPDLATDESYQRFVVNPPENSVVVEVNWNDNPWFPKVLEEERLHCKRTNPIDYENIWEGKCRAAAEGAIYANELADCEINKRICNVPYDSNLKTFCIYDLGFSDDTAIIIAQRNLSEIRIIDYISGSQKTLAEYVSMLNAKPYVYAYDFLPHDAKHKTLGSNGLSVEDRLKGMGRKVKITPSMSIEQGIQTARGIFHQCYFDATKTQDLIESLRRYRRGVNSRTGVTGSPVHDESSHAADAFRYMALNATSFTNEERKPAPVAPRREAYDYGAGY